VDPVSSPSLARAIQILDFLTTHPGRGFTLSELSRQLSMSKATAHTVLGMLSEHALLVRSETTNEYRPGPALVPMGAVAERSFPALERAKHEAEQLAESYDAECMILMPTGEDVLIVSRAGVPGPLSFGILEGQRHPLAPPFAPIALAWSTAEEVEAWLDRAGDELAEAEREHYRQAIEADRRRGYGFALRVQGLFGIYELYAAGNPYTPEGRRKIREAYGALAKDPEHIPVSEDVPPDAELSSMTAPVFGPDGKVLLLMGLNFIGVEQYRARDRPHLARALTKATGRVMAAIDGRPPVNNGQLRA
jgi:DNA-binding IclR family transcriptional regulator